MKKKVGGETGFWYNFSGGVEGGEVPTFWEGGWGVLPLIPHQIKKDTSGIF